MLALLRISKACLIARSVNAVRMSVVFIHRALGDQHTVHWRFSSCSSKYISGRKNRAIHSSARSFVQTALFTSSGALASLAPARSHYSLRCAHVFPRSRVHSARVDVPEPSCSEPKCDNPHQDRNGSDSSQRAFAVNLNAA